MNRSDRKQYRKRLHRLEIAARMKTCPHLPEEEILRRMKALTKDMAPSLVQNIFMPNVFEPNYLEKMKKWREETRKVEQEWLKKRLLRKWGKRK